MKELPVISRLWTCYTHCTHLWHSDSWWINRYDPLSLI